MSDLTSTVIAESKSVFLERFKGPAYVYMFSAVILFNWENILILFLSHKEIEERISLVWVVWDGWLYFWKPVLLGLGASIIIPFISLLVYFITSFAVHGVNKINDLTGDILQTFTKWRKNEIGNIEKNIADIKVVLENKKQELEKITGSISYGQAQIDNMRDELVKVIARVVFMAGYVETHDKDAKSLENLVRRHGLLYNNNEDEANKAYLLLEDLLEGDKSKTDMENEIKKSLSYMSDEEHMKRIAKWLKKPDNYTDNKVAE
ncbi:hypothetical protein [Kosakonia sp. MUSA4]|uniref:hypothetical protein n=1 Tax=Kosakonia sp. MUSA4 TaxID=2067958 RepID=UPI001ABF25C3|nr:hypothetical protein [Kosakonia sp. MUSA4]